MLHDINQPNGQTIIAKRNASTDPRPQDARWYRITFIAVLILLGISAIVVKWRLDPVQPRNLDSASSMFSATRAFHVLDDVLGNQQPHPVDSRAEGSVRQRIVEHLHAWGYQANVQDAFSCRDFRIYTCARVRNIIAVQKGSSSGSAILLSAHYDSVPAGPGASDDGSGVAILLSIARSLKAQPRTRNSVVFLFSDGEEAGLLGAKAFASEYLPKLDIAADINLEARGTSGQSAMFETGKHSNWLLRTFAATAERPLTNSLLNAVYQLMPNDTDLSVFKQAGMSGLNFAYGRHLSFYHSPRDNLQNLDVGSLQQQGDNVQDLVMALVNSPLHVDRAVSPAASNDVYTDVLELGVFSWSAPVGVILSILLLVVFIFATIRLHKRYSYRAAGVALGILAFPAVLILAGVGAYLVNLVLEALNGPTTPWHSADIANTALLWCVVFFFSVWVPRLFIRAANPVGVWVGSGFAWLVVGIMTALFASGISYLFILPGVLLVLMALIGFTLTKRWGDAAWSAVFLVPAVAAFIIILPSVMLLKVMMGYNVPIGVIGTGVFLGLTAIFMLPLLGGSLGARVHRYAGVIVVVTAAAAAFVSLSAPAYTAAHPEPLNVYFVQDADGAAHILAGSRSRPPPAEILRALGNHLALDHPLPWIDSAFYSAPAQPIGLQAPQLQVVSDSPTGPGAGRDVVVRLQAGSDVLGLLLLIPSSDGLASITVDGHRLDYANKASMIKGYKAFLCRGLSCDGKRLSLRFTHDVSEPLLLVRMSAGLPPKALAVANSRGPTATPRNNGDQTIVIAKLRLPDSR